MSNAYHSLATNDFFQDWTGTNLIMADDNWSGVPSIIGFRGDGLTGAANVDPRTVTAADAPGVVHVVANSGVAPDGGVLEVDIANDTIALQGSATAAAPYLLLHMDATGRRNVTLSFQARELDADNADQQIGVQYRIGETGAFTNLPDGYIADASNGASLVTLVSVLLPQDADGAAQIQIRIITTNATGNDSLIGIDDINVTSLAPNAAPVLTSLNATPTYLEQAAAVIIDADATISDAELDALNGGLGNYSAASLQISDAALSTASVLEFAVMADVTRVGNALQAGGNTIATIGIAAGVININFTDVNGSTPTTSLVNEILRASTYANTLDNPPGTVTLNYTFNDGDPAGALTDTGSVTVNVTAINDLPTDIGLSSTTIQEFRANGTVVATLSTADLDGSAHSYSLLNNAGGRFTIVGNQLRIANGLLLDFEQATTHNITVRTTDSGNATFDELFTINVGNVDPEVITGDGAANTLVGGAGADTLRGGGGNDILRGNGNRDQLDGGLGADVLEGGLGNDIYTVNNAADQVVEAANGNTDLVKSSATAFTLGGNVENLTLTGLGNNNGTGNALSNVVIGNAGNNRLSGGAGVDTLNGGAGIDIMTGGAGNDTYMVDRSIDHAIEATNAGTDRVVSTATFTLGANVENLTLTGAGKINGTGNARNNAITGNSKDNILTGLAGLDVLTGGAGNDVLIGGVGKDTMTGGTGVDDFDFNGAAEIGKGATRDIIRDFAHLIDDIDLSTIDANGALAGHTFSFLATKGAAFTGAAGQLRWFQSGATTIVEGTVNADKVADFQIQLTGLKTLTAADFIL